MTTLSSTDTYANIQLVLNSADLMYPLNPILAELTTVQAILESALEHAPPSQLALKYNNLFGIKGIGSGMIIDGKMKSTVTLPTHEYFPGQGMLEVDQRFAVNASIQDSLLQHKSLLDLPRYKPVRDAETFEEAAKAIRECGYATDPAYTKLLIALHNEYFEEDV